jgi:two-component system, NtrC family, sensor kinase
VEEALRRTEKLAATGQLAASIAHEINNPLAAVTNILYIMRTHPEMPATLLELVGTGERELERVIHITRQTLAFYREVAMPVLTSVPSLIEEVLGVYSRKIEDNDVSVEKSFEAVEEIRAFPGELRQVLSNLVLNALEALPGPGRVAIRVRRSTGKAGKPGLRITVADNGPGIAPEHLPRIFEPFFTTKPSKGTGLGLWVSHGIVHKHQGSIRVRTRVDEAAHGTCFVIFLPYTRAEDQESDLPEVAADAAAGFLPRASAAASGTDLSVA